MEFFKVNISEITEKRELRESSDDTLGSLLGSLFISSDEDQDIVETVNVRVGSLLKFEKIKAEYMNKKMEQIKEIDELEKSFQYYAQFFEPQIELQMSNDNYVVALTQINHLDNPQPDFIQICVGILLEDRSNYADLKNKANELIKEELLENYPQIFN